MSKETKSTEQKVDLEILADFIGEQMRAFIDNSPDKVLRYGGPANHITKTCDTEKIVKVMPGEIYGKALNLGFYCLKHKDRKKYNSLNKILSKHNYSNELGYEESREASDYLCTNVIRFLLSDTKKEEKQHGENIRNNLGIIYSTKYNMSEVLNIKYILENPKESSYFTIEK